MGETTDRFFLYPRQLFSSGQISVFDAINLVLYAKVPLVEVRSGRDLVAGFVRRGEPYVKALMTKSQEDRILEKYKKAIGELRFPVAPSQYEPLLERMLESGEAALPYFYQEYHQLAARRRRIVMFQTAYSELGREFQSKVVLLQRTHSELSDIFAADAWMTLKTLRAYLDRQGVAPWWDAERNISSHVRLERILFSDWNRLPPEHSEGYDLHNVPSFIFASRLLNLAQLSMGYANELPSRVVSHGSAEMASRDQREQPKKGVTAERSPDLSEHHLHDTADHDAGLPTNPLPARSQEAKRSIRVGQPPDNVKSSSLKESQPEVLPALTQVTDESVLTKKAVAKLLGVSVNTVDNYRNRQDFPEPIKYGPNTIRWERSAIVGWKLLQK